MHATWQALQPMHLVVSMSFATVPVYAPRTSGEGLVVAERRMMSSDCSGISHLLDLHEEGLELWCLRIGVTDHRGKRVGEEPGLGETGGSRVYRNADRVHRFAIHAERPQAFGDYRHRLDVAAVGGHFHLLAARDADLLRECLADLDELLRLHDRIQA